MVQIPDNQVTQKDLSEWYSLNEQLSALKTREQLLRQKIFKGLFQDPKEGTNSFELSDGFVVKGKYVINRTLDEAGFKAAAEVLSEHGIRTDSIVKYKPELVLSEYRKLTDEQRHLMDTVLIVKPGMPGLEIMQPKRASK